MNHDDFFYIVSGILVNFKYTAISLFFGILLGFLMAVVISNRKNKGILCMLITVYVSIFRGTPLLLQLSILYFALPQLIKFDITPFMAGIITFSMNSASYVCEIMRGGIQAIDKKQLQACKVLKINYFYQVKDIILPQALRSCFPALINETTTLLKETALMSTIGITEIMRRSNLVASKNFSYLEPLLTAAIVYYITLAIIVWVSKKIEKRISYES